jgi:MFS family permease
MIRDRSLLALLAGEFVSRLGSQFTTLALPWFVLVTTGSPSKMGLVFAVELAPIALLGIPSAVLVERFGPKRWLVSMDALRAPIVAAVPFLHAVGGLSFGLILVVGALHGAFSVGYFTSQRLILPAVVGEDEQRLAQANGVLEGTTNLTNLAGPALAGVLIAVLGAVNVMWIDAASYLASVVLIGLFVRVHRTVSEDTEDVGGIFAGLRYLRRDTLLARVSVSSLVFGFVFPMLSASFPVLAYQQYHHNPRVAGFLFAVIGAGQVVGSVLAYRLVTRIKPMRLASFAALATGPPLWFLVPHLPLAVVAVVLAVIGASVPLINAPYLGMLTMRVPPALRGHVLQSLITINQVLGPIGYVVAGTLFSRVGLHESYAVMAALGTFATLNFVLAAAPMWGGTVAKEAA